MTWGAMGTANDLRVRALTVDLGGRPVLQDCSFVAAPGEFIIVAGPNGAGKSTLVRAIAGLQSHHGTVAFGAEEAGMMDIARRARLVAYLPQHGAINWPMPVRDVVALGRLPFAASLQRLSREDEQAISKAMFDCDVTHLADCLATELSGGELSRVLLARALAAQAPILLLDEPAASLDPSHQSAVMEMLTRIAQSGKLVVAVSHDIVQATQYASRMIVLAAGKIVADGAPRDLLDAGLLERIFSMRFHRVDIGGEEAIAIAVRRA